MNNFGAIGTKSQILALITKHFLTYMRIQNQNATSTNYEKNCRV